MTVKITNRYINKEKFEQIKKLRLLKEYTMSIKEAINEETYKMLINNFDIEIKSIQDNIKTE